VCERTLCVIFRLQRSFRPSSVHTSPREEARHPARRRRNIRCDFPGHPGWSVGCSEYRERVGRRKERLGRKRTRPAGPPEKANDERPSLKVVAVSDDALRSELLDALVDESACKTVVVESMSSAYSRIREIEPHVVIVFMDIDDANACQLLSMLESDRTLSGIPVITCADVKRRCHPEAMRFSGTRGGCSSAQQLC
jgi:CheY-like chemotaxis protein